MKILYHCFVAVLMTLFYAGALGADAIQLKWGGIRNQSGGYGGIVFIKDAVNDAFPNKIVVTVVKTKNFATTIVKIHNKSIDLGPAGVVDAYAAYMGQGDYKDNAITELRSLWGGYLQPIHIITSVSSNITTVEGLDKQKFAMNPGTSSGKLIKKFFQAQGILPEYQNFNIASSADAMKQGAVQGWFKACFKEDVIDDLEQTIGINILPITKSMLSKMNAAYPSQGLSLIVQSEMYRSIQAPQLSLAYMVNDFVHKDIAENVVYDIVKTVWENRSELAAKLGIPGTAGLDNMYQTAAGYNLTVPFHPGAARFFRETLNVTIPDRLLPPEMKISPKPD